MSKDLFFNLKVFQKIAKLLFFVLIFSVQSRNAFATHAAGADLTYRFISHSNSLGDVYEITGTFYRDCSGVAAPNSLDIVISSASCNYNNSTISLPKIPNT